MNTMAVLAIGGLGLAGMTLFQGIRVLAQEGGEDSIPLTLTRYVWQAAAFAFVLLALTRFNE